MSSSSSSSSPAISSSSSSSSSSTSSGTEAVTVSIEGKTPRRILQDQLKAFHTRISEQVMVLALAKTAAARKAATKEIDSLRASASLLSDTLSDMKVQSDDYLQSVLESSVDNNQPSSVNLLQDQFNVMSAAATAERKAIRSNERGNIGIVKFPKNLPIWKDNLSVVSFFEDTESVHLAYGTDPNLWVRGLVNQTAGETRLWVSRTLVQPQVSWTDAQTLFSEHFGAFDAPGLAMDKLVSMKQKPKQSVSSYRDHALTLAHTANVSVNEQWVVRSWSNNLLSSIQKELSRKKEVHKRYSFDEISSLALYIEHNLEINSTLRTVSERDQSRNPRSSDRIPHKVSHTSRLKTKLSCSFCKKSGHTESTCWQKRTKTSTSGGSKFNPKNFPRGTCYQCGSRGHMRGNCPELKSRSGTEKALNYLLNQPKVRAIRTAGRIVDLPNDRTDLNGCVDNCQIRQQLNRKRIKQFLSEDFDAKAVAAECGGNSPMICAVSIDESHSDTESDYGSHDSDNPEEPNMVAEILLEESLPLSGLG